MAVDKNLFVYDLALVAIMKNEGPYLKEWLDYHILAGVDHFFIYDNESSDNLKQVLQPYIDAGLVTYKFYPGKMRQLEAYMDAVNRYRFFCRYMTFIDGDEFILPKSNRSITEVVDEILADNPQAGALGINWHCFGSNGQEKADFSRGVLERFTRRAPNDWTPPWSPNKQLKGGNAHIKSISNPRLINFFTQAHSAIYFEGYHTVNENGDNIPWAFNYPVTDEKIVINHYVTKSKEECEKRAILSGAENLSERFNNHDRNEVFDDGILKYRTARQLVGGVLSQSQ